MKKIMIQISFLLVAILLLSPASLSFASHHEKGETTAAEVKKEAGQTYEAIKNYTLEQKEEALRTAKEKLNEVDERLEKARQKMDKNWNEMTASAREKTRETMKHLRQKREDLAEWYGGMKHSSADAWDEVKDGFVDSYSRLENAVKDAADEFNKSE